MGNPCLQCGACCAFFRVSFYWSEADPFLGGGVPAELTEPINPHHGAMKGTLGAPARCVALDGRIGEAVCCTLYERRPSPCRELEPWDANGQPDEKCSRARAPRSAAARPEQGRSGLARAPLAAGRLTDPARGRLYSGFPDKAGRYPHRLTTKG